MIEDLERRFKHHPPKNTEVASVHEDVRSCCLVLARFINDVAPDGREKSLAVTKLEEVMFWANAAIARKN